MKDRNTAVAGLAAGYLLGRTHKTRLAITLAAAAAIGRLGLRPSERLERRLEGLASSEVGKIAEAARGELFDAVKEAATTAATSRIDALTERVTSALPGVEDAHREDEDEEEDTHREDEDEEEDEEEEEENENVEDESGDAEVKKHRPATRRTTSRTRGSSAPRTSRRRAEPKDEKATTSRRASRTTSRSTR